MANRAIRPKSSANLNGVIPVKTGTADPVSLKTASGKAAVAAMEGEMRGKREEGGKMEMVGGTGFEPVTSAMSTQRSIPLS